ncbi:hypothetical protein [Streptomyces sp. MOE7]|uniref:hypothetical protein n=1 Tax=Streptomyces sp. MOE7 TaxID=1961713 RepID=UPI001F1B15C9|nr:hypothetical protein [Streptomyces sp. MOE7]
MKHGRRAVAVLAALAAGTALPGTMAVARAESLPGYRTASGATQVRGTSSAADAPQLTPGLHTDAIQRGEQKYYAVTLDAKHTAYFSAVAAPRPGTKVEDYKDKLTISIQDSSGTSCGPDATPAFSGGGMAYPIADYAARRIGADRTECQKAGPYYVVVRREGSATSGPEPWPIELNHLDEPRSRARPRHGRHRAAGAPRRQLHARTPRSALPGAARASTTPVRSPPVFGRTTSSPARPASTGCRWTGGSGSI